MKLSTVLTLAAAVAGSAIGIAVTAKIVKSTSKKEMEPEEKNIDEQQDEETYTESTVKEKVVMYGVPMVLGVTGAMVIDKLLKPVYEYRTNCEIIARMVVKAIDNGNLTAVELAEMAQS